MTVKEELHALVDQMVEEEASDVLDYVRARLNLAQLPSPKFLDECRQAVDEATRPNAVWIPHEAVRAWLTTWGTPEEAEADARLRETEARARRAAQDTAG